MIGVQYPAVLLLAIPIVFILIILIKRDFVKFKDKLEQQEYRRKTKIARALIALSRTIIFLCLLVAISSPFMTKSVTVPGDYSLLMLADNSTSFSIFDKETAPELKTELEKQLPVTFRYMASGTRSALGDALLNNMRGNGNVLVVTDGNNNYGKDLGDVMVLASTLNTTINYLDVSPTKNEASVSIEGPSRVIMGSENDFIARVTVVGTLSYNLIVRVDNKIIIDESGTASKDYQFSEKFLEGFHEIEARITASDYFKQNNVFYKTVRVEPKPNVLFISTKASPFMQILSSTYRVDSMNELPSDLKKYSAVIINDIPADKLNPKTDLLRDYVMDGKGLFVVGGKNSFDYGGYENTEFESLLPVKVGTTQVTGAGASNIVFVVDISGSTIGVLDKGVKYQIEAAILSGILGGIKKESNVGIVAFDTEALPISYLSPYSTKTDLNETILSIRSRGGGTYIYYGFLEAYRWLGAAEGSKNVILISDGETIAPGRALLFAKKMGEEGFKIYTIGVGAATNTQFMKDLAEAGKGMYFDGDDVPKINIIFGEEKRKQEKEAMGLVVLNRNHFITESLELDGYISGYNQVVPKSNAKLLVSTIGMYPVLTTWRMGLGRIAVLSTDDGYAWGGVLLNEKNSKIITRAINWAIGDLGRAKDFDVSIKDTTINEQTDITVFSIDPFTSSEFEFSKVDENLYNAKFTQDTGGFKEALDTRYAVNYETEYGKIGLNPELKNLVTLTGGRKFDPNDVNEIVREVKAMSIRVKTEIVDMKWPFIVLALGLFLIEVCIRRITENRNLFK